MTLLSGFGPVGSLGDHSQMTSCRQSILAAIVGAVVLTFAASSASALPRFHQTDAVYSTSAPALNQGTIEVLSFVSSGCFLSPSDVILEGAHYLVGNLSLNAGSPIKDDRWKHKKFDKEERPASDLQATPTLWIFGAGLALMIVLVLLRKRQQKN